MDKRTRLSYRSLTFFRRSENPNYSPTIGLFGVQIIQIPRVNRRNTRLFIVSMCQPVPSHGVLWLRTSGLSGPTAAHEPNKANSACGSSQGWFLEAEFMGCLRDAIGRANLGLLVSSRECGLAGIGFATERTDREGTLVHISRFSPTPSGSRGVSRVPPIRMVVRCSLFPCGQSALLQRANSNRAVPVDVFSRKLAAVTNTSNGSGEVAGEPRPPLVVEPVPPERVLPCAIVLPVTLLVVSVVP